MKLLLASLLLVNITQGLFPERAHAAYPFCLLGIPSPVIVKGDRNYPPFEFINHKGEPDGFYVELMRAIFNELDLEYRLELDVWSRVRHELETGQIDMVTAMIVSPGRAGKVRFGVPHNAVTHGIFSHGSHQFASIDEIRGKEIIVKEGDIMHDYLIETGLAGRIITVPDILTGLLLLQEGQHHAGLFGNIQATYLINENNISRVVARDPGLDPWFYAMAVSHGNDELLWMLNSALHQLKSNGVYDELYNKWLGKYEQGYYLNKLRPYFYGLLALVLVVTFFIIMLRLRVRRTMAKLNRSEGRFSAISSISPVGMGLIKHDCFLEVNQRFCELTGYSTHELIGEPVQKLFYSNDDFQAVYNMLVTQIDQSGFASSEARLKRKDGPTLHAVISLGSIPELEPKETIAFTLTDITFKHEALKHIRQVNERLMFQLENSPLAIIELDREQRVISWSVQAGRIFGWPPNKATGTMINDLKLIFDDDNEIFSGAIRELAAGTKRNVIQCRNLSSDGTILECEWYNSAVFNEQGELTGIFSLVSNVTELRKAERAIREERQRLSWIIEAAGIGTWEWDIKTRKLLVNPIFTSMLGYDQEEFHYNAFSLVEKLTHPDDLENVRKMMQLHYENPGLRYQSEFRMRHKKGHWVMILSRGSVISRADDGSPLLMVGTHTDISIIKEAEEQVLQVEKLLKAMVETLQKKSPAIDDMMQFAANGLVDLTRSKSGFLYNYDEKHGRFTNVIFAGNVANDCKLPNRDDDYELTGTGIWAEAVRQGKPIIVNNYNTDLAEKKGYPPGHIRIEKFMAIPVVSNGNVVMVAAVANKDADYTQHDLVQALLLLDTVCRVLEKIRYDEQIRKLSVATEQSPASVIITDKNGVIEYVNRQFSDVSGYSVDELTGKVARVFKPGHLPEERAGELWGTLEKGNIWRGEYLNRRKTGQTYWESLSISSVRDSNNAVTNYVLVGEDVTLDKQMKAELIAAKEKAEENDNLKTSFLNNLSHEVRTPLNAIMGFSEFITDDSLPDDKKRSYSEAIMKSSRYLLALIENIIAMSIIETGQARVNTSEVSINRLLNDVYSQIKVTTSREDILLRINPSMPRHDDMVLIDYTKVMQILINLVNNAIKFTRKGVVQFGCIKGEKELTFIVEDTGVGFPLELKDVLFERFRQGDNNITGIREGMGLGLSITKSYVELMDGNIELESQPGIGTKFMVNIPYVAVAETVPVFLSHEVTNIITPKTILIADDVDVNYLLVKEMVSNLNLNVLYARDGKEAFETTTANKEVCLVLMDIKMPVMDGFTATRLIKEARPEVVVIAQTAYAFPGDKQKASDAGCDGYIVKPINRLELIKLLGKHL